MKYLILVILIFLSITACKESAEKKLVAIGLDIIENPDKIYDLKKYYPEYYKEEYTDVVLKDAIQIKYIIHDMDSLFHRNKENLISRKNLYPFLEVKSIDNEKYKHMFLYMMVNESIRNNVEIFELKFWKNKDRGMCICFLKYMDKYYFLTIFGFVSGNQHSPSRQVFPPDG